MDRQAKVGWLLLESWQNSTPPIHHIFIQFFVPFGKEKRKNMARPGFEPMINQSIANWTTKLLEKYHQNLRLWRTKGTKNWIKMWWIGEVEFCQLSSKSQPTLVYLSLLFKSTTIWKVGAGSNEHDTNSLDFSFRFLGPTWFLFTYFCSRFILWKII